MNEKSPLPDIGCTISGKPHYFELGEIISEDVAEAVNPKRWGRDPGFSFSQENPFLYIVAKKATRTYTTDGAPVDLILHFDLKLGSRGVIDGLIQKHGERLKNLVTDGPFLGVWIYDSYTNFVVWSAARGR